MHAAIKALTKGTLANIPGLNGVFHRLILRETLQQDQSVVSRLASTAHALDHRLTRGQKIPRARLRECEFLIGEIRRRGIALTEELLWALELYAVVKQDLACGYRKAIDSAPRGDGASQVDAELIDGIKRRRSIRKWRDDGIAVEALEELIDVARWAPSSCNRQPWRLLIVSRAEDRKYLAGMYISQNTFWRSAPALALVLVDSNLYPDAQKHYAYLDAGAFIQNLLLAAEAHGYGGCWIGFCGWHAFGNGSAADSKREEFQRRFGLEANYVPVSIVSLGVPALSPRPPGRKSVADIVLAGAS